MTTEQIVKHKSAAEMSVQEYCSIQIMAALLNNPSIIEGEIKGMDAGKAASEIADRAVRYTDCLIAVLYGR